MKNKQLIILFLLSFSLISVSFAQIPTDGLIAHYPFNGNANDISENNNNGIVSGATLTFDRFNNPDQAYLFEASNGNHITLGTGISYSNSFTISIWFKYDQIHRGFLFNNYGGSDRGVIFADLGTGDFAFDGRGNFGSYFALRASNAHFDNEWHHFVGTINSNSWNAYIDNQLVASGTSPGGSNNLYDPGNDVYLGRSGNNSDHFDGSMDDVRLYDRALNASEIQALFNEASGGGGSGNSLWTEETGGGGIFYDNGKVRIGNVTTPGPYDLYVEKGILTEEVKVALKDGLEWPDYVFNEDYDLRTISELQTYISTNGHLPNMPSSVDLVEAGGFELKDMIIRQQEKIEELTLYIIELSQKLEKN